MSTYNWLEDRVDTTSVKLYSFVAKDFMTMVHQPGHQWPTRLQMFNQLQKTVEFRNELNDVIYGLEKLLDSAGRQTSTKETV